LDTTQPSAPDAPSKVIMEATTHGVFIRLHDD